MNEGSDMMTTSWFEMGVVRGCVQIGCDPDQ